MDIQQIQTDLKTRVAKGLNFGIEGLEDMLDPASDIYNEYILLKSKYNDLMYVSSMNTLPYEQIEIGLDRLRSNLLAIIGKLDEQSLKGKPVNPDLKIQALPTRRTNFFKLLDIHFNNLEAISYVEIYNDSEKQYTGREGIFKFYQSFRFRFRNREDLAQPEGLKAVKQEFYDFFHNEVGTLEVYYKNIKHLLAYSMESEIERMFFLDTLKSLFSRSEMALLFYHTFCEVDPALRQLVIENGLLDDSIKDILIAPEHWTLVGV
ncbi:MAG: hypothetical protein H6563_14300 [Lewinellaceae bacterium]|nr:hypothetical protein [Lewinellaceae bacterium]